MNQPFEQQLMQVASLNISEITGTAKQPVLEVTVTECGLENDSPTGSNSRQVSLLALERITAFNQEIVAGRKDARPLVNALKPGEFGENITTMGIDLRTVSLVGRFKIGEAEFEVTQIGKVCRNQACMIFRTLGQCLMPAEGLFCRVIRGGKIKVGNAIQYFPFILKVRIITLKDGAHGGIYTNKSGPRIRELLYELLAVRRWKLDISSSIISDEKLSLAGELQLAHQAGAHLIFTVGGTGVGPRDITPEVVIGFCDKLIPGIMEYIRVKYGETNPHALLSRSVAGLKDKTLVYALPGSISAIEEYLAEIIKTLEHLLLVTQCISH